MKKRVLLITSLTLLLILAASATMAFAGRPAGQNAPTLEGVRWVLASYTAGPGIEVAVIPDAPATAEFANGQVSGTTGCNTYTAPFEVKGASLTIGLTATTMKACADAVMIQEQAYIKNLQAAATYAIVGEELTIADATGAVILTFTAEKAGTLVGPTWVMTSYNNGRGGFQSGLADVEVTAVFGADGQLSGFGGCNTYSASFSVSGQTIKIGPAMSTKMACAQDIMTQEMAYLTALSNATVFELEGTKLTLRDASGAAMVGYAKGPAAAQSPVAVQSPAAVATPVAVATPAAAPGTTVMTTTVPAKADGVYLTLLPAADASMRTLALTLSPDGKATFVQDFFGEEQPITDTGAWIESDGVVTATLTDRGSAKMAVPQVLKFERDGTYLTLVDYDKSVWGEAGLKLNLAADVARKVRTGMVTLDLAAGFPLDPTFFSAHGGGEIDSSILDSACSGFIHREPTATVKWSGTAAQVRAFFYSDGDPTLMVLTPEGELVCSDNANENLLDPYIEIKNPAAGTYQIWVGSATRNQLIPGVLVLTAQNTVDLGTFDMDGLIKRPLIPQTSITATEVTTPTTTAATQAAGAAAKAAPQVQALIDKLLADAPTLQPGANVTVDFTADGILPLFRLPAAANKGCAGLVNGAPSYAFKWSGEADNLHLAVDAGADTTLMVVATGSRQLWCNDDGAAGSVNPTVDIANPADGTYLVYVGRISPEKPVTGQLTVVEGAKE